jgi:hypothetical protein
MPNCWLGRQEKTEKSCRRAASTYAALRRDKLAWLRKAQRAGKRTLNTRRPTTVERGKLLNAERRIAEQRSTRKHSRARYLTLKGQRPTLNVQRPTPNVQRRTPNAERPAPKRRCSCGRRRRRETRLLAVSSWRVRTRSSKSRGTANRRSKSYAAFRRNSFDFYCPSGDEQRILKREDSGRSRFGYLLFLCGGKRCVRRRISQRNHHELASYPYGA